MGNYRKGPVGEKRKRNVGKKINQKDQINFCVIFMRTIKSLLLSTGALQGHYSAGLIAAQSSPGLSRTPRAVTVFARRQ